MHVTDPAEWQGILDLAIFLLAVIGFDRYYSNLIFYQWAGIPALGFLLTG